MGEVKEYPNGTFCWIDLGTTDVAGAKAFYGGLFGWEMEDLPAGGAETYTMCRLGGKDVAGIHRHSPEEGIGWSSSIAVDDVDEATSRAAALGAEVLAKPFDIQGVARMSPIRDPAGAEVTLWRAKGHIGAAYVNDIGAWGWNELVAAEMNAAKDFYRELFGWEAEDVPAGIPRAIFTRGNLLIGGIHAPTPPEDPAPRWTVSFAVADADQSVSRAEELGGRVVMPPMDIQIGRFAIVADPAGATLTLAAVPAGPVRGVDGS
jgi:uncharacterized protein